MPTNTALAHLRRAAAAISSPCRPPSAIVPSSWSNFAASTLGRIGSLKFTAHDSRSFSTTCPRQTKTIKPHRLPSDLIPPYPYGERRIYKQSNRGLYGNARIRFGNNVAEKHNNKSRRFWRPNVHVKAFFSPALGARIKTRLTLRVLKTIRREGSIDEYLLKSKPARIRELGPGGWNLRWLIMQTQDIQHRMNKERLALGLEPKKVENRDDMIHFALDIATPGPLSLRSRALMEGGRSAIVDAFVLGNDDLAGVEGVEELSDEAEQELLQAEDLRHAGHPTLSTARSEV